VDAEGVVPRALRPRAVAARIRGPEMIVERINPASVLAIVNLSDTLVSKRSVTVPVELRGLPDEVDVVSIEPSSVTVLLPDTTPETP